MAASKTLLGAVHHISEHSIFFLPSRGDNLDLKTLSKAPPCHRAALQRHGLVAKIHAAIAFTGEVGEEGLTSCADRHALSLENDTTVKSITLSLNGRQEVWRSALTYAGLLSDKDAALAMPDSLQTTPWPLLTETQYRAYVKQAAERLTCTAVNNSSFCVPLLSLQEYVYQRTDLQLSLAVLWMPCYPRNLRQWAATFDALGKPIPEPFLLAMLHHVTIAQLTVRSGDTIAGRSGATAVSPPGIDAILVHQNEGDTEGQSGEWSEEPVFVLSASAAEESNVEKTRIPSTLINAVPHQQQKRQEEQERALYRPPEDCAPELFPTRVTDAGKRAVWGLGVMLYLLASGRLHLQTPQDGAGAVAVNTTRNPRRTRAVEEIPLNASAITPDHLWKRLRRDIERRGYSSTLTTVAAQLLSLDPLTRPSLTTVDRTLQDLHRPTPILRFPFVVGGYDLLRLRNPTNTVELNPGARRYTYAEMCVLCKKPRGSTPVCPKGGDHQTPGLTSPSWSDEHELLPGVSSLSDATYITFLYPLCGAANGRQRRKQTSHALQNANASMSTVVGANGSSPTAPDVVPLDCGFLLQVFGGFAVYERLPEQNAKGQVVHRVKVREVLVPYPSHGLRRSELALAKTTLEFGGGLPWPSCCTAALQKSGRVSRRVPFALTGAHHDVEWFAWVLPGERFALPNGADWTAPLDGAFVFWFGPDLQPTDRDRYFAVTGARAATLPTRVPRSLLPDSLFRQHVGDESHASTLLTRSLVSSASRSELQPGQSVPRSPSASAARRRSTQSVTDIILPAATHEIVEVETGGGPSTDAVPSNAASRPPSRCPIDTTDAEATSSRVPRRRRSSAANPRRSPSCQVSVVEAHAASSMDDGSSAGVTRSNATRSPAAATPSSPPTTATSTTNNPRNDVDRTPLTPPPPSTPPQCSTPASQTATAKMRSSAASDQENNAVTASSGASPECRTPAACGHISSRENTQPPSHRDTSSKNVRALAPLSANETIAATTSPRGSGKAAKKRRPRVMMATDTSRPTSQESTPEQPQKAPTVQAAARKLSPRPSRRPPSPQISVPTSARPLLGGFATPTVATPRLTPLSHAVSALGTLHVCGLWLPADVVDATFQALTFWVFATGEHGYMQAPIKMSTHMGYAIRAPPGAVYLAFLSNQVPLFRRNHPRLDVVVLSPTLPHHGFACYSAEGHLLGVLALRCSVRDDADVVHGEFVLDTHVRDACHGSQVSPRGVYASYLAGSVGDEKAILRGAVGGGEETPVHHLRHSPSFLQQNGLDSKTLWNTPSEAQTLTLTSARHLIGEFTPHDKDDFALYADEAAAPPLPLPACWVGFDGASGSLLFSDVGQSAWVPYSIGE